MPPLQLEPVNIPNQRQGLTQAEGKSPTYDSLYSSDLCRRCQHLFRDGKLGDPRSEPENMKIAYLRYDNFEVSASKGCQACAEILSAWGCDRGSNVMVTCTDKYMSATSDLRKLWTTEIVKDSGRLVERNMFAVNLVRTTPEMTVLRPYDLQDEPCSTTKDALSQCQEWYTHCRVSHQECKPLKGQLPTRLIDARHGKLRLCLGSRLGTGIQYATLSHCWGKVKFQTLETANVESFLSGIPSSALTKTFVDAILVTRSLGIHYLWIDSLCIIQDDVSDWECEAASMASVYGGAILNIAASGARDGSEGLFFERQQLWTRQIRVKPPSTSPTVWSCIPSEFATVGGPGDSPLASRGWVVQERFQSRRILHFDREQVFWECSEECASELFPRQVPSNMFLHMSPFTGFKRWSPPYSYYWRRVVEQYTRCKLSNPSDKLIAIASIAEELHARTGDQYLAGIWRGNLGNELCWYTGWSSRRILPHSAPTWSWASLDGSVILTPLAVDGKSLVSLVDVDITHATKYQFGPVTSGRLRLKCMHLLKPKLTGHGRECKVDLGDSSRNGFSLSFELDVWDLPRDLYSSWSKEVYLLPVTNFPLTELHDDTAGLILGRTGDASGKYQRLGRYGTRPRAPVSNGKPVDWKGYVGIVQLCEGVGYTAEGDDFVSVEDRLIDLC